MTVTITRTLTLTLTLALTLTLTLTPTLHSHRFTQTHTDRHRHHPGITQTSSDLHRCTAEWWLLIQEPAGHRTIITGYTLTLRDACSASVHC